MVHQGVRSVLSLKVDLHVGIEVAFVVEREDVIDPLAWL
jgi:hypothetical protein